MLRAIYILFYTTVDFTVSLQLHNKLIKISVTILTGRVQKSTFHIKNYFKFIMILHMINRLGDVLPSVTDT